MASAGRRLLTPTAVTLASRFLQRVGLPSITPAASSKCAVVKAPFPSRRLVWRLLSSVPDAWGRPTEYTEGTDFLGTPKDHLTLAEKRPKAPDVFEVGFKGMHYAFPIAAVSSVTNRVTGAVLWGGVTGVGCLAMVSDVGALVDWAQASFPLVLYPAKFGVSFCLIYHYLGGLRHFWFDYGNHGPTQAEKKTSPLEMSTVHQSSLVIMGCSALLSLGFMIA